MVLTLRFELTRHELVDITPHPALAWLDRAHQRMPGLVKMPGRMFIFRRVAAADMPARQAHAQVNPAIADFDAIFADARIGLRECDLIQVGALLCHWRSSLVGSCINRMPLKSIQ